MKITLSLEKAASSVRVQVSLASVHRSYEPAGVEALAFASIWFLSQAEFPQFTSSCADTCQQTSSLHRKQE